MLKKVNFKNIAVVIFCLILIYCFLLVGSPLKNNTQIINVLFNIITIIIIIVNFKNKKKVELTKIEIVILGLIILGFIPIIFRTQSSLSSTVDSILKYISVFNIFIIVKYILKIDKKYLNYIINAIIITSIVLLVFGIDMMNHNTFQNIYDFLDTISISNSSDIRMDSLYEYPNTFAMFLGISLILSLGSIIKLIKSDEYKKQKNENIHPLRFTKTELKIVFYSIVCFLQAYGIIMSGSRLSILLLLIALVLLLILEIGKKINARMIIIIISVIIICIIPIALCFTLNTKLVLFDETKQEKSQYIRQINNIEPNTEYNFDFEISALNKTHEDEKFKIIVRELTDTAEKIHDNVIVFDTFEGVKNIKLTTKEDTSMIRICFISKRNVEGLTKLEIKNLTMNGQKIRLNYLFIPISLINRIENISSNTSSITERFVIIKDGIKLASQNLFTGFGNDGWYYNYKEVREYDYGATQMHSYIIDLFIQDGIWGLLIEFTLLTLLGIKIIKIIKQKQNTYYPIIIACIFGLLHAFLDFDMNFFSILILIFILISIIDIGVEEKKIILKRQKIVRILGIICMILILIINTCSYIAYKIDNSNKSEDLSYNNWEEKLKQANIKVLLAPYHYDYLDEKIQICTVAKNSNKITLNQSTYQKFTDELIVMLENVIKNEQDRNISSAYRKLVINYTDKMNENNIDEILQKIENTTKKIDNERTLYSIQYELLYKLEEKNKILKNEKIQNLCEELYDKVRLIRKQ